MIYAVNKRTKMHRLDDGVKADEEVWVEADPDGWIEWHGGECPLPDGAFAEVRFRDHRTKLVKASNMLILWNHETPTRHDIIAYRPILGEQATLAGAKLWQDAEGTIPCREGDPVGYFVPPLEFDGIHDHVNLSKKPEPPAWNIVELPPVGLECEMLIAGWEEVFIAGMDSRGRAIAEVLSSGILIPTKDADLFRPIRSEADRAKEAIAGEVLAAMDNGLGSCFKDVQIAAVIYAAIRDGKVPGVKLEGPND